MADTAAEAARRVMIMMNIVQAAGAGGDAPAVKADLEWFKTMSSLDTGLKASNAGTLGAIRRDVVAAVVSKKGGGGLAAMAGNLFACCGAGAPGGADAPAAPAPEPAPEPVGRESVGRESTA